MFLLFLCDGIFRVLQVPKDGDYERLSQPQWLLGYFSWLSGIIFVKKNGHKPNGIPGIIFVRENDHKSSYGITWNPTCNLRLAWSPPE
jgi:hypothetical protein